MWFEVLKVLSTDISSVAEKNDLQFRRETNVSGQPEVSTYRKKTDIAA